MEIKMVALDMDGTLLDSQKRVPSDFIPWVKAHPKIRVVIASGRQYFTLKADFEEISGQLTYIAENGGLVFEGNELIYSDQMQDEDVWACLDHVKDMPSVSPILCGAKAAYMVPTKAYIEKEADIYYKSLIHTEDLYACVKQDKIVKLALFVDHKQAETMYPLMEGISERIKPVLSGCDWIDVANKSTSKGAAVQAIQKKFDISRDDSMAFGDYLNDYTLLQSCGESYCMENGHADLKAIAKYIADSNDHDGVMKVLRLLPEN